MGIKDGLGRSIGMDNKDPEVKPGSLGCDPDLWPDHDLSRLTREQIDEQYRILTGRMPMDDWIELADTLPRIGLGDDDLQTTTVNVIEFFAKKGLVFAEIE